MQWDDAIRYGGMNMRSLLKATAVSIMGSATLRQLVRGLQLQAAGPLDLRNKSSMRAALCGWKATRWWPASAT